MIANPPTTAGFGYTMSNEDMPGAVQIGMNTSQVAPHSAIEGTFHVFYVAPPDAVSPDAKIRYILLIDEQQFPIDGRQMYLDITVESRREKTFNISIPPLDPGIHHLLVIGLLDGELSISRESQTLVYRLTVVAGEISEPDAQRYHQLQPTVTKSQDSSVFTLGVHTEESQRMWVYPDIYKKVEGTLDFFISAGYLEDEQRLRESGITPQPMLTAFIGLIDGQQIALDGDSQAFYAAITPDNTYSFIPVSVDATGYTGKQELIILRINYPRIPICWLHGTGDSYWFNDIVYSSRVGVDFGE